MGFGLYVAKFSGKYLGLYTKKDMPVSFDSKA